MKKRVIVALTIMVTVLNFIFTIPVLAQTDTVRFENISTEQGLSQATVNAILQDQQGFMWFATEGGLISTMVTNLQYSNTTRMIPRHFLMIWLLHYMKARMEYCGSAQTQAWINLIKKQKHFCTILKIRAHQMLSKTRVSRR